MKSKPTIVIIGGGFSGAVTVIHLIRNATSPIKIILINKENIVSRGVAFNSYNNHHLLNVRVVNMSPFVDEPYHFAEWLRRQSDLKHFIVNEFPENYVSRNIFGRYMEELLQLTINNAPKFVEIKIINDEVTDVVPFENSAGIILKKEEPFVADKIVFALGNFLPANINIDNYEIYSSRKYFRNPWVADAIKNVYTEEAIFIIGTGLTMVDNVLSLLQKGYNGKIYALSKNGYLPLPHTARNAYTAIQSEAIPGKTLAELFEIFREHLKIAVALGHTYADVIDALRPQTQQLWIKLSLNDRKRFIRHLAIFWSISRHRLPQDIHDKMQELMMSGRLKVIAGHLINMVETDSSILISIKKRKTGELYKIHADRVINCTGPQTNIRKIDNELVKNLIKRGLITADPLGIAINADEDGKPIDINNQVSGRFYFIGSMLRGILWESSAVPELRQQAEHLSKQLLNEIQLKRIEVIS